MIILSLLLAGSAWAFSGSPECNRHDATLGALYQARLPKLRSCEKDSDCKLLPDTGPLCVFHCSGPLIIHRRYEKALRNFWKSPDFLAACEGARKDDCDTPPPTAGACLPPQTYRVACRSFPDKRMGKHCVIKMR